MATVEIDRGPDPGLQPFEPQDRQDAFSYSDREALYVDFQGLVKRLIRQYGDDPELRKDLPGEIYCRFCKLFKAFDPGRGIPLRAYMVRALTASVYTYARSEWRRQNREILLSPETDAFSLKEGFDPRREWDRNLMMQEVLAALPDAIEKLPVRQRQVIVWRLYEHRSFDDIASRLRIRPATARSLLRHGLNGLRRHMAMFKPTFG